MQGLQHTVAILVLMRYLRRPFEVRWRTPPIATPSGLVCVIRVVRQILGAVCVVCIVIHVVCTVSIVSRVKRKLS